MSHHQAHLLQIEISRRAFFHARTSTSKRPAFLMGSNYVARDYSDDTGTLAIRKSIRLSACLLVACKHSAPANAMTFLARCVVSRSLLHLPGSILSDKQTQTALAYFSAILVRATSYNDGITINMCNCLSYLIHIYARKLFNNFNSYFNSLIV